MTPSNPALPKSVRIGGQVFKVIQEKSTHIKGHPEAVGLYSPGDGEIRIAAIPFAHRKAEIFLHECIHGMIDAGNLDFDDEECVYDEEIVTRVFAAQLVALLSDNPTLVKYLSAVFHTPSK